jgi:hypothetical protein
MVFVNYSRWMPTLYLKTVHDHFTELVGAAVTL